MVIETFQMTIKTWIMHTKHSKSTYKKVLQTLLLLSTTIQNVVSRSMLLRESIRGCQMQSKETKQQRNNSMN